MSPPKENRDGESWRGSWRAVIIAPSTSSTFQRRRVRHLASLRGSFRLEAAASVGRHKAAQNCTVLPWVSAKADCKEPKFLQIGVSLLESKAFQELSPATRLLYLAMCEDAAGRQSFEFPRSRFAHYGISNTAARAGIKKLIEAGFIVCEFSGKINREANRFRFSFAWKLNKPP